MSMDTFYGENPPLSSIHLKNNASLGILTKTHVMPTQQGFERVHDFLLQDQSAKLLPRERVTKCLKNRIDKTKQRDVKYNEDRKKAHWSNVQRCGSVWICPVCAKQITEKRREELKKGIDIWKKQHNGAVFLLTLTFSHSANQPLKFLLLSLRNAMKRFYETTKVQSIFKKLGVKYKIKGLEATYGKNGWHPHHHVLLLTDVYHLDFKKYRNELAELWIKACVRSGLNAPSMTHGLDLRDGTYAQEYVSKWGLETELTKGHLKKGRNDSLTPFDLLQLSIDDQDVFSKKPSKLWQEFGIAIKGSRQLEWGKGLKKLLGIADKSDEELAEESEQNSILLRLVDDYLFGLLCHYQMRWDFLRCLERDYENGCFGSGETEQLIFSLLEKELAGEVA
jgi:hypothetical protein